MQFQFGPMPEGGGERGSLVTSIVQRRLKEERGNVAPSCICPFPRFLNYGHYTCEQGEGGGEERRGEQATVATGLAIIGQGCRTD